MNYKVKLYGISIAEGASVMAAEICGAKLLSPFFGSSLYVWSSVMAATLGGLASGYYLGGILSRRDNKENILSYLLILSASYLSSMPYLTKTFFYLAAVIPLIPAVIISTIILLFPVMLLMGAASPLIISLISDNQKNGGEVSGRIFSISTVGGILATFLCGFYLIPNFGIKLTLILFAICLVLMSLLLMFERSKRISHFLALIIPLLLVLYGFKNTSKNKYCIYQSESLIGNLEIRDEPSYSNPKQINRKLLINNIIQTEMQLSNNQSTSDYIKIIQSNLKHFKHGNALVLGLGGGVLANMLFKGQYNVTAVEMDDRIIDAARHFFYLNSNVKAVCDDARCFINKENQTYNLIVFDLFKAEVQPSYVITKESLEKVKLLLNPKGCVIINTHGYLNGETGMGTQALISTLKNSGFQIKICSSSSVEDYRNVLIYASIMPLPLNLDGELNTFFINVEQINTDDKPILEKMNASASQAWRKNYLKNYILYN